MRSRSAVISISIHLVAIALMFMAGRHVARTRMLEPARLVVPLTWRPPGQPAGGGGGNRSPLPPSRGRLPPPARRRAFVPPAIAANPPKLPLAPALLDAPDIRIDASNWGDPLARAGLASGGPGHGGGFGSGCCAGVGPGSGPRFATAGSASPPATFRTTRYTSPPRLLYKIDPEYPDEARKARYEGTVLLAVRIGAAGNAENIRIVRGLGMGLEERAAEAVGRWRFSPALDSGRAVTSEVVVEVHFRLL